MDDGRLLHSVRAGFGGLAILLARAAGHADGPDNLPIHHEGNASLHRNGALKAEETEAVATGCKPFLKRFGWTFEPRRRARLADCNVDAARLRRVHLFEVHEV